MALLFMDGFDHFDSDYLIYKWGRVNAGTSSGLVINTTGGRGDGGYCSLGGNYLMSTFLSSRSDWVIGAAFRYSEAVPASAFSIFTLDDGIFGQCILRLNVDLTLSVVNVGTGAVGTSTFTLTPNTWHYIEWKVIIGNSIAADSCVVRVDGVVRLNVAAGQDLQNTANATASVFRIGTNSSPGGTISYDDLYILDQTGPAPLNDFLGDVRVACLFPSGVGNNTQWTPDSGANWQQVDEATIGLASTDGVESTQAGNTDTYQFSDMPTNVDTIYGIQQVAFATLEADGGYRELAMVCDSGGTVSVGSNTNPVEVPFATTRILTTDPATGAAWTKSGVDAAQFGQRIVT